MQIDFVSLFRRLAQSDTNDSTRFWSCQKWGKNGVCDQCHSQESFPLLFRFSFLALPNKMQGVWSEIPWFGIPRLYLVSLLIAFDSLCAEAAASLDDRGCLSYTQYSLVGMHTTRECIACTFSAFSFHDRAWMAANNQRISVWRLWLAFTVIQR